MPEQDTPFIISRILSGDRDSFDMLVARYQTGLVFYCFTFVKDADMADELAQESFIKAYFKLKNYNPDYRFSTWLYKIATNTCLDYLRRTQHLSLDDVPELSNEETSQFDQAVRKDEARLIRQAVAQLPLKYQTAISLYYWQEQRYEEIATIMGVPLGTVKVWLHRAKTLLKERLEREYR